MSGCIDECIKYVYSDRLKKITPLDSRKGNVVYEISMNRSANKEILKVLLKKCFTSSCLSVFKKRIEFINSKCIECKNLIKSNILYENSEYLLISRFKSNNKLEMMNGKELKEYFELNGSYILLKSLIKVLKIFHSNNLCYGGIKLSNIMINLDSENDEDKYEICDYFYFILNDNKINISEENMNYISPEELLNCEKTSGKDMWNIGILLYKLLSGKFPFEDKTMIETFNNILNVEFDDLKVEFNELLNPLIHKLLIKESENRISIVEFENEIDKINSMSYIEDVIPFVEEEVKFISEYKHEAISISEDSKTIVKNGDCYGYPHCYLNVKMSENIHHFIYKINGDSGICSSDNEYNGDFLYDEKSSFSIDLWSKHSKLYNKIGNKMKEEYFNDILGKEGEEYELIFNMNEKTMSIKKGNGEEILLFTNITTPVYPFVILARNKDSVSLIKYWKEEEEVKFISEYKHEAISISEDSKTIALIDGIDGYAHCYLNVKMSENIHHFIYKIQNGNYGICFGCSSNNKYDGKYLHDDKSSCSIGFYDYQSYLYGSNGKNMKKGRFYDINGKGEEYELIYNMNEKRMSIKQGSGEEILLFTNINTPVYPFVGIKWKNDSVSLIKYWKE